MWTSPCLIMTSTLINQGGRWCQREDRGELSDGPTILRDLAVVLVDPPPRDRNKDIRLTDVHL